MPSVNETIKITSVAMAAVIVIMHVLHHFSAHFFTLYYIFCSGTAVTCTYVKKVEW